MQILLYANCYLCCFCKFPTFFSAFFILQFWRGNFLQTILTHADDVCHFIFAYLSTNVCRDFFYHFVNEFFKFQPRHIFVHWTTSSKFFYKKTLFETHSTPYQLCSGNKTLGIFEFFFLEKKDNLVEIHFGHFYFCPFQKSQGQFCFEVSFLEKKPFFTRISKT